MKRKYSDEKILQILGEVKTGAKVQDTCCNWKSQYEGMQVNKIKRLKVLESKNQNQ